MFARLLAAVGLGSRSGAPELPVINDTPAVLDAPAVASAPAAVAKPPICRLAAVATPRAAVRAYFDHMMDYVAGNDIPFRDLMHGYEAMRADGHRWPKLSAMALSRHLVALGCTRSQVDLRHEGKGRPTLLRFPRAVDESERRRAAA